MNPLHTQILPLLAAYPPDSQCESPDPIISVKLFALASGATWWLADYDPETRIAFCYVTGMAFDEWGTVSIDELAELRWQGIPQVEMDIHFTPKTFSELEKKNFLF